MEREQTEIAVLDSTDVVLSAHAKNLILIIFSLLCLAVPFWIGHPQLLVGSVVNALLVLAALHLGKNYIWPIILLPSIGVLARGMVFGPFTMFLVYMIPVIWLGNFALVYVFKYLYLHKKIYSVFSFIISVVAKVAILRGVAWVMVYLGVLPKIFLTTMGALQISTALIGGGVAIGVYYAFQKKPSLH